VKTLVGGNQVGGHQNYPRHVYHDDPIEEIPRSKFSSKLFTAGSLILGCIFFFQTTFASDISINSGSAVEFGQGVSQTVACSGDTTLTITPQSSFINTDPGAHYLSSVIVSNIPVSCYGVDLTINFYDITNSTPLALFNTTSTSAVIYNNAGAFSRGTGSTGMTVASSSGTFTATFTTPVALSSNVFKLTIKSGAHTPYYYVGGAGPGGGFVYYENVAGFNCGATYTSTGSPTGGKCNYLEVAPSGWNTGSDPTKPWAISYYQGADIDGITNETSANNSSTGVGLGYKNSLAIVTLIGLYNESSNNYAAGAARAYAGGSKSDWYLPTTAELNLLCQWNRGVAPSVTTACTGGSRNSATYGAGSAGFVEYSYLSSSEYSAYSAWFQRFDNVNVYQSANSKNGTLYVRPVRAF
jgi:hypothetical protein